MNHEFTMAWGRTQAQLPEGWTLDSLRCASTAIRPEERSEDWIAVAVGPVGQEVHAQALDPIEALEQLVAAFAGAAG